MKDVWYTMPVDSWDALVALVSVWYLYRTVFHWLKVEL